MATATAFSELLAAAEADDLIWAALVRHQDGSLEVIGYDGNAAVFATARQARRLFGEWLLSREPVSCDEAAAAGIITLNACRRCTRVRARQAA